MFCPNCGNPNQQETTFCRQCGKFLPDMSGKLAKYGKKTETPQELIRTNLILNSMSAVVSLISALVLYILFWNRGGEFTAVFVIAAFLLAMGGWQLSTFFNGLKLRKKFNLNANQPVQTAQTYSPHEIEQIKTNELLPEADLSSAIRQSVTENTTRQLYEIPRK